MEDKDPLQQLLRMLENDTGSEYFSFEDLFPAPPESEFKFRIISAIVYGTLAMLGVIANLIFVLVVWKTDKLHSVTHMLMTNLAISNLLFLLFHPPYFMFTYILNADWLLGSIICKTSFSIAYITVTGSFYFMTLVAIDRWLAIFYRKHRLDRKKCIKLTVGSWVISVIVASPFIYQSDVQNMNTKYAPMWRCGRMATTYDTHIFVATFVLQYIVPLLIMIPAYSHLAYFLWRRPTIGVQSKEKTKKAHSRRRRLICTLIGILVILIACWSPLFSVPIVHRVNANFSFTPYIVTSMIALLSILFTPICYLTNDGFSQQFITLFCFLRKKKTDASNATTKRLLKKEKPSTKKRPKAESTSANQYLSTPNGNRPVTRELSGHFTPKSFVHSADTPDWQSTCDICETEQ